MRAASHANSAICRAAVSTGRTPARASRVLGFDPWRESNRTPASLETSSVWMADPIVDGRRAAISWWASLIEDGAETTLAGTSVLVFDADGLVIEQWDAWNQLPHRSDPPGDIGPFAGE